MNASTLVLLCASSLFSASALAHWQWVDAQGRKVFSDLPPPAQVPSDRIIQRPSALPRAATVAPAPPVEQHTGIDKELQAGKAAETAQQAQREQTRAKEQERLRQDNCTRARTALASLTEGRLLGHTNAQGERAFMDDATRAAEQRRAHTVIASDCAKALPGASPSGQPRQPPPQ